MLNVGKRISAEVLALPYVQTVEQQVGRAELGEDTWGPHRSEFHVELKADATRRPEMRRRRSCGTSWRTIPGFRARSLPSSGDRISESLSGETAQVAVKVFGDDLDALDATADKIVAALGKVTGIVDLQFKRQSGTPTIAIQLMPAALAASRAQSPGRSRHGRIRLSPARSSARPSRALAPSMSCVLLPDALRHQPASLAKLMIGTPLGPCRCPRSPT